MKKRNVLTIAALLTVAFFHVKAAEINILYAPSEWHLQTGMAIEWEDEANGVMAFEVETGGSHEAWVAAIVTLDNIDVDKYSQIVVKTTGLTGGTWNMKISNPDEPGDFCYSFFNNSNNGGDQSAIGEYTFNLNDPLPEGYKLSGETSFKIWIWVIGKGERLLVSELYLTDGDDSQTLRTWSPQNNSTNWNISDNWSGGRVPKATSNVFIPVSATYPELSGNATIANLTMDFGAEINITGTATLTTGKVKVNYPVTSGDWDAVGFPFSASGNGIYCPEYEANDPTWDSTLYPYKENAGENEYTDFWLKSYDGTNNRFEYTQSLSAGQGYIIQFPEAFGSGIYTAVFESTEVNNVFEYKNSVEVSETEDVYKLVANPALEEIALTSSNGNYYYQYDAGTNNFKKMNALTVKPFESVISVRNSGVNPTLRSSIALGNEDTTFSETISELNDPVIEKRYYTLQGIEAVNTPVNKIYLVKKIHASGKVTIQKMFNVKND